jgi:hypothetical protein
MSVEKINVGKNTINIDTNNIFEKSFDKKNFI